MNNNFHKGQVVRGVNSGKEYIIISKHWQMVTQDYRCYYWVEDNLGNSKPVYASDLVAGEEKCDAKD